jgi:rubrerythrin
MTQRSQGNTGISNVQYDLVSVMYHALQGAQTNETYSRDAEQEGDQEAAQFFREVKQEDQKRAERGKQLFTQRASKVGSR